MSKASKIRILIAEDDKLIQSQYKLGLSAELFELKFVTDCKHAVKTYEEWRPNIIILDYGLRNCNGTKVLKYIRETSKDQKTTVVMVTSMSDQDIVIACSRLGIQGYIKKPFKTKEIAWMITDYHREHEKEADF